jgi:hypothetical protein
VKKFVFLALLLGGCATAEKPTPPQMCSSLCQEASQSKSLIYAEDTCVCSTENGVKNKLGMCAVSTGTPEACVMQALSECQAPDLKRVDEGFCSRLEQALSGQQLRQ